MDFVILEPVVSLSLVPVFVVAVLIAVVSCVPGSLVLLVGTMSGVVFEVRPVSVVTEEEAPACSVVDGETPLLRAGVVVGVVMPLSVD